MPFGGIRAAAARRAVSDPVVRRTLRRRGGLDGSRSGAIETAVLATLRKPARREPTQAHRRSGLKSACLLADDDRLELARLPGRRLSPRHQGLREGSASEALLLDDVELQVLIEIGEWAAALTDRNRDRRKVVFVDETETGE